MQLSRPLDFYAVTDHGMFLGLAGAAADTSTEFSKERVFRALSWFERTGEYGRGFTGCIEPNAHLQFFYAGSSLTDS